VRTGVKDSVERSFNVEQGDWFVIHPDDFGAARGNIRDPRDLLKSFHAFLGLQPSAFSRQPSSVSPLADS
jgi:hypothetical protein